VYQLCKTTVSTHEHTTDLSKSNKRQVLDNAVYLLGYGLDKTEIEFRVLTGARKFLFSKETRPVLRPTQSSVQWVHGALFLGVKRPGLETDH